LAFPSEGSAYPFEGSAFPSEDWVFPFKDSAFPFEDSAYSLITLAFSFAANSACRRVGLETPSKVAVSSGSFIADIAEDTIIDKDLAVIKDTVVNTIEATVSSGIAD
jgi:hypothetical protein